MPATIQIFDPALCCSSGVCGPSVDPELARFSADVAWLIERGVQVERFNLAQQPGMFVHNPLVKQALAHGGTKVLPLTVVDGRIVVESSYPSRETLAALAGLTPAPVGARRLTILTESPAACCGTTDGTIAAKTGCC